MIPYLESAPDHYCRLFPPSKVSDPDRWSALSELGAAMLDSGLPDGSLVDAGFTYFGQFIDHDLTKMAPLNPPVGGDKAKDQNLSDRTDVRASFVNISNDLKNLQTPKLDLSHLYGGGPYDESSQKLYKYDHLRFNVGCRNASGRSFDVYVDPGDGRPVLADDRSGENLIIRQMVAVFAKLHNAAVTQWQLLIKDPVELFEQARKQTVWQFQYLVVKDFLGNVLDPNVFREVFEEGKITFDWRTTFSIPVEFAVAAFRFGHSMVRVRYLFSLSDSPEEFALSEIFERALKPGQLEDKWEIKWGCFFNGAGQVDDNGHSDSSLVHAQAIDTLVAKPLHELFDPHLVTSIIKLFPVTDLPLPITAVSPGQFRLPVRTLLRGESMQLASGQMAAAAFEVVRLSDDNLTCERLGTPAETPHKPILERAQLLSATPLWYYILKESEISWDGNHLGPVGSRIVAETISGSLRHDLTSYFYTSERPGSLDWRLRNRLLLSSPPVWRIDGEECRIFTLSDLFRLAPRLPAD